MKNYLNTILLVLVLGLLGYVIATKDADSLGASRDVTTVSNPQVFSTFTEGGGIYATTTLGAAQKLVATDIDTENFVEVNQGSPAATLSLPASSTMKSFAPNVGDVRTIWIRNASTSGNAILTVGAGAGMTFKTAASSSVNIQGDTDGDNTMRIDLIRKADSDFNVYLTRFQD